MTVDKLRKKLASSSVSTTCEIEMLTKREASYGIVYFTPAGK